MNRSFNASAVGEGLPRGRGIDERAARAAAEIRRKAAARGQPLRQNPTAALTHQNLSASLTQLLNIINSGEMPASGADMKAEFSGGNEDVGNGNGNGNANEKPHTREEKKTAPVGLGTSLELKKQKSKSKATSS
jgi:protein TIF31